jgi:hypothetical protein
MLIWWGGYSVSLWGWCLIRGYDVTLGQLMSPTHPYGAGKGEKWPPKLIGGDVVFPGGRTAAAAGPAPASSAKSAAPAVSNQLAGTNRPAGMR